MITSIDETPGQIPLTVLALLCQDELKRYRRKESGEQSYCLELIRRAVQQQSEQAWAVIQECFSETLCCWIRSHSSRDTALRLDTEENYVAQTIARFWSAMRDQSVVFTSLAAVLSYLRATLTGILIDTVRTYHRSQVVALPEPDYPGEPFIEDVLDDEDIWQSIQPLLPDARERRLAYLLYYCGLKPREIIIHCPDEYTNIKEIYRLNQNFLDRLRRNHERLRWSLEDVI
ncbi:MAG TPA: hypothetical protein VKV40_03835 [Ktedonobacteraceae bacterium]|nr:hypothetical protein [Ktedonobacteraceae bacterium]